MFLPIIFGIEAGFLFKKNNWYKRSELLLQHFMFNEKILPIDRNWKQQLYSFKDILNLQSLIKLLLVFDSGKEKVQISPTRRVDRGIEKNTGLTGSHHNPEVWWSFTSKLTQKHIFLQPSSLATFPVKGHSAFVWIE